MNNRTKPRKDDTEMRNRYQAGIQREEKQALRSVSDRRSGVDIRIITDTYMNANLILGIRKPPYGGFLLKLLEIIPQQSK